MPANGFLYYKPGMTMDTPVSIVMAATDWAIFMSWMAQQDCNGISGLRDLMSAQLTEAIYTPDSLKSAQAAYHEYVEQASNPFAAVFTSPFQGTLTPEDFNDDENEDDDDV